MSTLHRPQRARHDSIKSSPNLRKGDTTLLSIDDVLQVVSNQDTYDGGVNCQVCGKLYKSKVCFIKHIWEHTVYWPMFKGIKNHDRVLSIQAAIILCCAAKNQDSTVSVMNNLLVTYPHPSPEKKIEAECPGKRQKKIAAGSGRLSQQLMKDMTCGEENLGDLGFNNPCIKDLFDGDSKQPNRNLNVKRQFNCVGQSQEAMSLSSYFCDIHASLKSAKTVHSLSSNSQESTRISHVNIWEGFGKSQLLNDFSASESNISENFVSPLKKKRGD